MRTALFQLDAFTDRRFAGNPAAVMPMEAFADDATLQAIAAENNLAETAFLVRETDGADSDYRLRWFTPTVEVPLCGHATLASAAVVMERLEPGRTSVVFHSASGPLRARRAGPRYVLDFPAATLTPVQSTSALAEALGTTPVEVVADAGNYLVVVDDAEVVRTLAPDFAAIARLGRNGVIVTARGDRGHDIVSRYFAPAIGIPEDPVTGAAHCLLAPYWAPRLGKTSLHAHQASERGGELTCRLIGNRVELEGGCVFYLEGFVEY